MASSGSGVAEASELPTAELQHLRSYLEAEFAKQNSLLNVLVQHSPGPFPTVRQDQALGHESPSLLTEPDHPEEELSPVQLDGSVQEKASSGRESASGVSHLDTITVRPSRKKDTLFWKTSESQMAQANFQARHLTRSRRAKSESEGDRTLKENFQQFVNSAWFSNVIMVLIMANVILMGVEVDVSSSLGQEDIPSWFNTVNLIMVGAFVLEMVLKHIALGCSGFWFGQGSGWNMFDFAVVLVSVVECVLDFWAQSLESNSGQVRVLRTVRLIRALRGMRLLRLFRYVLALRTLMLSIIATTGSLFWTLLLLMTMCYSFGMAISQFVLDHCRFQAIDSTGDPNAVPDCASNLRRYWSSVPESMLTLFLAISGGLSWDEALRPLRDFSPLGSSLFLLYIFMAVFAILNVVTGVFCNTAIESASADKELATVKYERKKKSQVETLRQIFQELDRSDDQHISLKDVETAMYSGRLSNFLESMGIPMEDVWTFFMLIDTNENGLLELDEFVSGCMQLNGPAKSIQLAKMSYENKVTRKEIRSITEELQSLRQLLGAVPDSQERVAETKSRRCLASEYF